MWDDLEAAQKILTEFDVAAVNDAGVEFSGHLSFWATLHQEKFAIWQRHRAQRRRDMGCLMVSRRKHANTRIDRVVPERWRGSSGLYAVQVAMTLGYTRMVLCGIPMDKTPHFFRNEAWQAASRYRLGWKDAVSEIHEHVRSMSGWTRGLLGAPSVEWLTQ